MHFSLMLPHIVCELAHGHAHSQGSGVHRVCVCSRHNTNDLLYKALHGIIPPIKTSTLRCTHTCVCTKLIKQPNGFGIIGSILQSFAT
jgi:hypothetical protein